MYLNKRKMPIELLYYNALSLRRDLSSQERYKKEKLKRGYEGECQYDHILDEIGHENIYVIRDVYLRIGNTDTQYDTIIISENRIVVNEIKNYTGDYRYENNRWFRNNKPMNDNAFAQLDRAKGKLMNLVDDANLHVKVEAALIFTSDDLRLTSEDQRIWQETIVRNHLRNYLRQFYNEHLGNKAKSITNIIRNSIVDNSYFEETADINQLRRGLYCGECSSFNLIKKRFQFVCAECKTVEGLDSHLLRAMHDYKYLFYNQPMTHQSLTYLINNEINRSTVYRAFQKHCNINKKGNYTTYTLKYQSLEEALEINRKTQRYKDKLVTNR